jgi:hypothetical protein
MEHKLVNGVQIPLSAEEIAQRQADELAWSAGAFDRAMSSLRQKRNSLLSATDYTQLPDVGFNAAEKNNYMIYRQALRDITNNIETAEQAKSIVFPPKP